MTKEGKKSPNVRYALIMAFYWSNYAILLVFVLCFSLAGAFLMFFGVKTYRPGRV